MLDLSLAVDRPSSCFALMATGSQAELVLWNTSGTLKTVGIGLKPISPPSTAEPGEKSEIGDIYHCSSKELKLADKVVPGYDIPHR